MLKVENRESAHLKSRVKDLSVVPNLVNYTALLAAITPIAAKVPKNDEVYEPVLIRDTESLISTFGDPRVDPEKYIDLYTIMQMIGNGATAYVAKVNSGTEGEYELYLDAELKDAGIDSSDSTGKTYTVSNIAVGHDVVAVYKVGTDESKTLINGVLPVEVSSGNVTIILNEALDSSETLKVVTASATGIVAYSAMTENLDFNFKVIQAKPTALKAFYLNAGISKGDVVLIDSKIKLNPDTTNQGLINALNDKLAPYVRFELADKSTAGACEAINGGANSLVKKLLARAGAINTDGNRKDATAITTDLTDISVTTATPDFSVNLDKYINAIEQFKDHKYVGCIMADMVAPVTDSSKKLIELTPDERRTLHFNLHNVAVERKDTTLVLSTPCKKDGAYVTIDEACNWVASQGDYSSLWEYGHTDTTDYDEQGFYMEMYYSWVTMQCTWLDNGQAKSKPVDVAPAGLVVNNILASYRERGIHLPVAGDQYGKLPDGCKVIKNPATKAERDQLVQYRINPIYDTGTRGVQIYGNETLNAGYTDLNAAHIARTLVYLRSTIDEYTEKLKFSINSLILWDTWKNYVTNYILEPLVTTGALSSYSVAMGEDTTSPEEIANRIIRGDVSVTFYQSAEIFDLTYTVYSSATTVEAAQAAGY